jgi:hypothetical protein
VPHLKSRLLTLLLFLRLTTKLGRHKRSSLFVERQRRMGEVDMIGTGIVKDPDEGSALGDFDPTSFKTFDNLKLTNR